MMFLKTYGRGLIFIVVVFVLNSYLWITRLNQSFLNLEVLVTSLFGLYEEHFDDDDEVYDDRDDREDDGEDTEVYDDGYDDDMYVSTINLPQAILDYLNTNYPNIGIDEVEIEDGMYGIELDNDLELYFDLNGNFLSVEYDD